MAIFNSPQQENGIVANRVQADLRDAGGLVLDHHNKADIIIKSPKFFFSSVHVTGMFTSYCMFTQSIKCAIALYLKYNVYALILKYYTCGGFISIFGKTNTIL